MAEWFKYPEENLDYVFDFTDRLETGETIVSYEVTVPDGLALGAVSEADGIVTAWIDGGVSGNYYAVECVVTTSAGREMKAMAVMYVR